MKRMVAAFAISSGKQGNFLKIPSYSCALFGGFRRGTKLIKNLDDALHLFDQMLQLEPPPPTSAYTNLFNALLGMNHHSQVILLFKKLHLLGRPLDECAMPILINCYSQLKQIDLAFMILATFLKRGYAPDIVSVTSLINGLFLEEKLGKAQRLFEKLIIDESCGFSEITLSIVLEELCKSGNINIAWGLLEVYEKQNYEPDVAFYNTVIHGLCRNEMVDDAMVLLSKMFVRCIPPTLVTYNKLIHGFCNVGRWDEANKLLKQMMNSKIYPDINTFNILVHAFCKKGLVEDAEKMIKIMTTGIMHPDVYTDGGLMDGLDLDGGLIGRLDSEGQPDKVKEVLNLMVNRGVKPDVVSYGALINGYCRQKKIDHAWKAFEEMAQKGLKHNTIVYNTMMQGLFSVGRCSDALKLFDGMKVFGHDTSRYTYGIILNGLIGNGLIEDAATFLNEECQGPACHIGFYNIFIHGLFKHRQVNYACSIFNNLSLKGLYPNVRTYNVMIKGLCKAELHQEAKQVIEHMEQSGCFPDGDTYEILRRYPRLCGATCE